MAIQLGDLQFEYSGGVGNTIPSDSIGGLISGELIVSQTVTDFAITGITIVEAFGNAEGIGEMKWDDTVGTTGELTWKSPGGSTFNGQIIPDTAGAPTLYTIGDPSGYVVVSVVYSSLPAATQDTCTVTHNDENIFDDITALQSLDGLVEYRCIYLINNGASTASGVKIWIGQQPLGADTLEIGLEDIGVEPTAIANDTTAPAGVSFTAPSTFAGALTLSGDGNLDAGEFVAIWEKREVLAGNNVQTNNNTSYLSVATTI